MGKYGFLNINGDVVIEPVFDEVEEFGDGIALVTKNNEIFIMKQSGETIRLSQFTAAGPVKSGLFWVYDKEKDKYGVLNKSLESVIPCKYDRITVYENNQIRGKLGKEVHLLDSNGDIIISDFRLFGNLNNDRALIKQKMNFGYLDNQGEVAIPIEYDMANKFSNELGVVFKGGKWGAIDKFGETVVPFRYNFLSNFNDDVAFFGLKKIGLLNKNGTVLVKPLYEEYKNYSEGYAPVKLNGKWGYIDNEGRIHITPQFDEAERFKNGYAIINKDGTDGLLSITGEVKFIANKKLGQEVSSGLISFRDKCR
ncbi:WG repeat-containing protein [Paenibacillus methanolicus]|uniref:WG repeat protein n=1 Tax=Paenibacillus methanolicus TaxID=582686 RepID=A0A5S5BNZ2_9BACL|nr:WG repeat-containing protein [Paenibacillus methanolicus]TYP68891.1 WG repeat protein [Paenibacillus methanolicus]